MEYQAGDQSLLDDPKRLLLDMAQEYSGVELLRLINFQRRNHVLAAGVGDCLNCG
jgi:hypothetical protein